MSMSLDEQWLQAGEVALPGSFQARSKASKLIGSGTHPKPMQVTVLVRACRSLPDDIATCRTPLSRTDFAQQFSATAEDLAAVANFAATHGLKVKTSNPVTRTLTLYGKAEQLQSAFHITLNDYKDASGTYWGYEGFISVPAALTDIVEGVFGLDNRRQAQPLITMAPVEMNTLANPRQPILTPLEIAQRYQFPDDADGTGQTIAFIEFGGGYTRKDLDNYFNQLGLKTPSITSITVDGVHNMPTLPDSTGATPDAAVMFDLEIAGALAPGARLAVYFAPPTERGWIDALRTAIHDTIHAPTIISISWGWSENLGLWSTQAMKAINATLREAAALGITILCASGTDHAADGQPNEKHHADFPASSPFVTGIGHASLERWCNAGTSLVDSNTPRTARERSSDDPLAHLAIQALTQAELMPRPRPASLSRQKQPDHASERTPYTHYPIRVQGKQRSANGAGTATPLWAALIARINQRRGMPLGFLNHLLYTSTQSTLRDVVLRTDSAAGETSSPALSRENPPSDADAPPSASLLSALSETLSTETAADVLQESSAALAASAPEDFAEPPPLPSENQRFDPATGTIGGTQLVDGFGQGIAVGEDGDIWAIGGFAAFDGYLIHHWNGLAWAPSEIVDTRTGMNKAGPLAGVRLSAGEAGQLAVVNAFGIITIRHGLDDWAVLPGIATDVAYGPGSVLWAVGSFSDRGRTELAVWAEGRWHVEESPGIRIAITGTGHPVVVTADGIVLCRSQAGWQTLPGLYADIETGPQGALYTVGIDGVAHLRTLNAATPAHAQVIATGVNDVAANASQLWMTTRDGRILRVIPGGSAP